MPPRPITMLPRLALAPRRGRSRPFPLGAPGVSVWYNARAAIWQGVRRLGLERGDRVLVPAYACGSEIDALRKAGLAIDCYPLLPDLRPDLDHVAECVGPRTRALYVTHYFGRAQPMDALVAFARARGLVVVEDAAHALYSQDERGRPLGSLGDMSVFSFGKSIAVPDGGALVLGAERARLPEGEAPDALTVAGTVQYHVEQTLRFPFPRLSRTAERRLTGPLVAWLKARVGRVSPALPADPAAAYLARNALELGRAGWRMSAAARLLLRLQLDARIPARRRRNFVALGERIAESDRVVPLLGSLPPGCCPLWFPVRVEGADALERFLVARSVEARRFWPYWHPDVPAEAFPFERTLRNTVVALPVHQGLDEEDMERMAALVVGWARGAAAAA